jgi:HAD superfamily hydrolase (TIGR01450 family)
VNREEIINSTLIIKKYLHTYYSSKKFYAIAEKKFIKEIEDCGLIYSTNPSEIDLVIVTLDRTLNYSKLEIAASALDVGAHFFAANIDNTCPVEGGEILDAGATISALEKRTNKKLEKHFGKPSKYILKEALKRLKVPAKKCLIVGDRLETDIAMANLYKIDSVLVATGINNQVEFLNNFVPTYKIKSVADLLN